MQEGPELLDFGVDEVAEQLTLMDVVRTREGRRRWGGGQIPLNTDPTHPPPPSPSSQELFSRVRPCECLGSVWSQRDRPGAAGICPTVRATVTQFNTVTGCVLGSVLGAPGLAAPQRAQRLEKWIRIAQVRVAEVTRGRGMEAGLRSKERKGATEGRRQGSGTVERVGAGRCLEKSLGGGLAVPGRER